MEFPDSVMKAADVKQDFKKVFHCGEKVDTQFLFE
jgi:hypothetical protein